MSIYIAINDKLVHLFVKIVSKSLALKEFEAVSSQTLQISFNWATPFGSGMWIGQLVH